MAQSREAVRFFLVLVIAAAFFLMLYPALTPGVDIISFDIPAPRPGENIDTDKANGHVEAKHPDAVAIWKAIEEGTCQPRIFLQNGLCDPNQAFKGYLICAGYPNNKFAVVPIEYDSVNGWVAKTAFWSDGHYVDRVLERDNCEWFGELFAVRWQDE